MLPPSDVFPGLFFDALRNRLADIEPAVDSATPGNNPPDYSSPLTASSQTASNTLLMSLGAADPRVHRCFVQEIRHNAIDIRLAMLRRKRLGVRRTREAKRRRKQQLDAVGKAECGAALQDVSTLNHEFQLYLKETHTKATARLQALNYECIAEMKKALIRMESISAHTTQESESMAEDLRCRYEWQFFLARLQQDCAGDVVVSLLASGDKSSKCSNSANQTRASKLSVRAVLYRVLREQGPVMGNGEELTIRSVISLRRATPAHRSSKTSGRFAPSLHFGMSASEMWTEELGKLMSQASSFKTRRVKSSSSARRTRRLPPSREAAASESKPDFSACDGICSAFRQLNSGGTLQFPGGACDVPLSSIYIQWMLPAQSHSPGRFSDDVTTRKDWLQHVSVADFNIYFDIAEYEQKIAAITQNYATSAVSDNESATCPIDQTVLASARRSLREISAIFERTRQRKKGYCADTIFAHRKMQPGDDTSSGLNDPSVFARASVLQLVQTHYYSQCFLAMLPGVDAAVLRNLYPSALFGEGCLTSLYVPVVSCLGKSKEQQDAAIAPPSKVSMLALSDSAIHELLLVYAVRGRHALTHASDSNQQLTSLALSDAVNTLIPCRKSGSNQPAGARFCVIKNPRGFWKQSNITGNQEDLLLDFRDADFVFIECAISSTQLGSSRQLKATQNFKIQGLQDMLGPSCMWRSCIISREFQDSQNDSNLCMWHTSVQRCLEADEWRQYTPNECRVKEERFIVETEALVERTKRVILVSSSLLEELSTRHLPQSIEAFYEHVINTSSNHVYQTEVLRQTRLAGIANGITSVSDLEESHRELRRLVHVSEEILDTENCATRELKQLLQLSTPLFSEGDAEYYCKIYNYTLHKAVYPGVADSYIQHDFFDVGELQSDIRTRDLELRLRLGRQKLQILMRRRKDEEIQVVSSTPLPGMNFHAAPRQAGLNNPEIGPSVYDVIKLCARVVSHCCGNNAATDTKVVTNPSDTLNCLAALSVGRPTWLFRVSPYEDKMMQATKYRTKSANSKRALRKNPNR